MNDNIIADAHDGSLAAPNDGLCIKCNGTGETEEDAQGALGYTVKRSCTACPDQRMPRPDIERARLDAHGTAKPKTEIVAVMPNLGEHAHTVHTGQATHYIARPTTHSSEPIAARLAKHELECLECSDDNGWCWIAQSILAKRYAKPTTIPRTQEVRANHGCGCTWIEKPAHITVAETLEPCGLHAEWARSFSGQRLNKTKGAHLEQDKP